MNLKYLPKEILVQILLNLNAYEIDKIFKDTPKLKHVVCTDGADNFLWGSILLRNKTDSLFKFLKNENSIFTRIVKWHWDNIKFVGGLISIIFYISIGFYIFIISVGILSNVPQLTDCLGG